jgi:uncharacterized protein (DUF433 family)
VTGPARITMDDAVMAGVPCVTGTRIPVVTILRMLGDGLDPALALFDFPQLTREDLIACVQYAADVLDVDDDAPRWSRMTVGDLMERLNTQGNVLGLMNPDGTAGAFVLRATPDIVRLIEDLTMRADVPPSTPDGG